MDGAATASAATPETSAAGAAATELGGAAALTSSCASGATAAGDSTDNASVAGAPGADDVGGFSVAPLAKLRTLASSAAAAAGSEPALTMSRMRASSSRLACITACAWSSAGTAPVSILMTRVS